MMVGDRLETDILMGQQAGMVTAVTLTGVSKREDVAKMASPPDFIVENLGEVVRYSGATYVVVAQRLPCSWLITLSNAWLIVCRVLNTPKEVKKTAACHRQPLDLISLCRIRLGAQI